MMQGRNVVVVSQAALPWPLILVDQGAFCSSSELPPCVQTVGPGLGNFQAHQALYRLEYGLTASCLIGLVWLEACGI
jgi:hypothetical protein